MSDINTQFTDDQKLAMNVISLNTAVNDIQEQVKTLNKVLLHGNGEPSIREQVRNHDKFIGDIKYWTRFIGGALILQTLTFLVSIIIAVVRFLPLLESLVVQGK